MVDKGQIAARIDRTAARQYGHVTRSQLLAFGMAQRAISRRVQAGRLIVVHAGVYAVGHIEQSATARAAAAVLACGPDALLSHESAAALWGLRRWPRRPEVTSPGKRSRPGIRTHRSDTLLRRDARTHQRIRTTSPVRTIVDIAPRLSDRQLTRIVNEARHMRLVSGGELSDLLARCPRVARLVNPAQRPTKSEFEDAFQAFVKRHRLPAPQVNVTVSGFEVDVFFAEERLIVELDGWDFHQDRRAFEDDRERDVVHAVDGYLTVRLTWERLTQQPRREAARLRKILKQRRPD